MEFSNTYDFFGAVANSELSYTDRMVYIENVTNNFDINRLDILLFDLDIFLDMQEQQFDYDEEEVKQAIQETKSWGLEIPMIPFPNPEYYLKKNRGEPYKHLNPESPLIDYPALLHCQPIMNLRELKENLEKFIKNKNLKEPQEISLKKIKWKGNNVELAELIKALIESNKLDPTITQKEIFKRFSLFLDYDLKETTGIKDFSKRKDKGGNLTKFLDTLRDSLTNWFMTKEENKDYR